jgi:hypothetical protein
MNAIKGAIDLHTHSYPSIFPRVFTDWEHVEMARRAEMAGVVIKSHEGSSVERAVLINEKTEGIQVFGGIVLNYFIGGINPLAVDVAVRLGGKIVWMPTFSSVQHKAFFSTRKSSFLQGGKLHHPEEGLSILDENGKLKPEVHEVLDIIQEANIILSTGHISVAELRVLAEEVKRRKIEKFLITHADLLIAQVPIDMQIELAKQGAIIEKCFLVTNHEFNGVDLTQFKGLIEKVGAEHCAIVTDYGQKHQINPVEAFAMCVEKLMELGVTESDMDLMIRRNPYRLLGI